MIFGRNLTDATGQSLEPTLFDCFASEEAMPKRVSVATRRADQGFG